MFHIKAKLKESPIHGIGLFADEDIKQGDKIYSANDKLNLLLTSEELSELPSDEQRTIQHYGYFDTTKNKWKISFDDIRFCNHSSDNNLIRQGGDVLAKRDIQKGEELTHDYNNFENPIRSERGIV